jgi:hypothetical protein
MVPALGFPISLCLSVFVPTHQQASIYPLKRSGVYLMPTPVDSCEYFFGLSLFQHGAFSGIR